MRTLKEWLHWALDLDVMYQEELGRSCFSDPEAFVNWTWHRARGETPTWIRDRIRESDEWQKVHRGSTPPPPTFPTPPPPGRMPMPATGSRLISVTTGNDRYHPRMYSYWSNAWVQGTRAIVFAGSMTTGKAKFFDVNIMQGVSQEVVYPAMDEFPGTTEGWSWTGKGMIALADGPRLIHIDPATGELHTILDITHTHPRCRLWQPHSKANTHCATVERITTSGPYERIGVVAWYKERQRFFPSEGLLDESDCTGRFLIIKEERQRDRLRLDNRIINLETGEDFWLLDEEGALGHSDCWDEVMVGENDIVGMCTRWHLETRLSEYLYPTWNMGHVSMRGNRILISDDTSLRLAFSGGTHHLIDHGVTVRDYDSQVRANLDPTGCVACYMAHGQVMLYAL